MRAYRYIHYSTVPYRNKGILRHDFTSPKIMCETSKRLKWRILQKSHIFSQRSLAYKTTFDYGFIVIRSVCLYTCLDLTLDQCPVLSDRHFHGMKHLIKNTLLIRRAVVHHLRYLLFVCSCVSVLITFQQGVNCCVKLPCDPDYHLQTGRFSSALNARKKFFPFSPADFRNGAGRGRQRICFFL